jgi:hypothetical protein
MVAICCPAFVSVARLLVRAALINMAASIPNPSVPASSAMGAACINWAVVMGALTPGVAENRAIGAA